MDVQDVKAFLAAQDPELFGDLVGAPAPATVVEPTSSPTITSGLSVPDKGIPSDLVVKFEAEVLKPGTLYERYNGNRRKIANAIVRLEYLPRLIEAGIYPDGTIWHKVPELKRIARDLRSFTTPADVSAPDNPEATRTVSRRPARPQCVNSDCHLFVKADGSPCARGHQQTDEDTVYVTHLVVMYDAQDENEVLHPALSHWLSLAPTNDEVSFSVSS